MSRLDWKKGRYSADVETNSIFSGLEGWRAENGDWFNYYRFNAGASVMDDVYDEASGSGKSYFPPVRVPAIHVVHVQGENEYGDMGFYYNDQLTITVSFEQFSLVGMEYADITAGDYLKDRILYNGQVYRVVQMSSRRKIQERSIIIEISCQQLKPDELIDDAEFAQWSS